MSEPTSDTGRESNEDERTWLPEDEDLVTEVSPDAVEPTLPLEADGADAVDQRLEIPLGDDERR